MEYKLNISKKEFNDIYSGAKKFLIRNDNIQFNIGDLLILEESNNGVFSGNILHRIVSFVESDKKVLKENFVIIGITESSKLYT